MILELPSSEKVNIDKLQYLKYITPAAQAEREQEREARQQEILVEQSDIVNTLETQCRLDQATIENDPNSDVIFISPFIGVDCSSQSGVLAAVPASGEIYNDLSAEYVTLNTDPPYQAISIPSEAEIDKGLIDKYQVLLETWVFHIELAGQVLIPPGNVVSAASLFRPAYLTPILIKDTVTTMYFTEIKPYNKLHDAYVKAQKQKFLDYNSPEAKAARLQQRIDNIPVLEAQADQVRAAIAVEEQKLANLVLEDLGDVIVIGGGDEPPADQITDPVTFSRPSLDSIDTDIQSVRSESKKVYTDYLSGDLVALGATADSTENKLLFKTVTVRNLTDDINKTRLSLNTIDVVVAQEDRAAVIAIIGFEQAAVPKILSGAKNLDAIIKQIATVRRQKITLSDLNKLVPNLTYVPTAKIPEIESNIKTLVGDPTLTSSSSIEDHVNSLITGMTIRFNFDMDQFLADAQTQTSTNPLLIKQFQEICDLVNTALTQKISATGKNGAAFVAQQKQVQSANSTSQQMSLLYDSLIHIHFDLIALQPLGEEILTLIDDFDLLTGDPTDIFNKYNDLLSKYQAARNETFGVINGLPIDEKAVIQPLVDQQNQTDQVINETNNQIAQQQAKRLAIRVQTKADLEAHLAQSTAELASVQANVIEDTEKVHSYTVMRALAASFGQERDSIKAHVTAQTAHLNQLQSELTSKQTALAALPGDVVFISERILLQSQIDALTGQINSIVIPDITNLIFLIEDLIQWLLNSISRTLNELNNLLNSIQNKIDHPEVDPPFIFVDPFDEVYNASHAIVHHFNLHLVKYLSSIFFNPVALPYPQLSTLTFTPAVIDEATVSSTAKKIADDIKSSPSASDFFQAALNFVLNGLIKRLDQHIIAYGELVGTVTTFFPFPGVPITEFVTLRIF